MGRELVVSAEEHGDRAALVFEDRTIGYREFLDLALRVAGDLRERGLEAGDRVAVMLPNVPAFAIVFYGVQLAGGIAVPVNPLCKEREVAHYVGDSGARFLVVGEHQAGAETRFGAVVLGVDAYATQLTGGQPAEPAERAADDIAVIIYTAGMTGVSRGAQLSNANVGSNARVVADELLDLGPDDVILGCLPFFHAFGLTCTLGSAVSRGATLVLVPRFTPGKALELMRRHGVSVLLAVPTMLAGLLASGHEGLPALRTCVSGGSSLPVALLERFEAEFGTPVYEGYGLSETSPVASFNHPKLGRKAGSIGTPMTGVEMDLVDGEIVIRGENLMKGYWKADDATARVVRDGWLFTGDLAERDEDGYYFITGRSKDLVIRGGLNVYPGEIETVLLEHPAVAEAAVHPVPDEALGEEVAAAVVLRDGMTATPDELRTFVRSQVAPYKYPRTVRLVPALPKDPEGRIIRSAL
ncbi:long-chain fatty acid--CoA ligase [Actinocorallia longicatena]|uniref:Long-chain fatty acid--CoA ligase n=1 Tax=Actinocorallia longicatena TaxID=111803 RepID=A0ABP6PWH2_9ACTN